MMNKGYKTIEAYEVVKSALKFEVKDFNIVCEVFLNGITYKLYIKDEIMTMGKDEEIAFSEITYSIFLDILIIEALKIV